MAEPSRQRRSRPRLGASWAAAVLGLLAQVPVEGNAQPLAVERVANIRARLAGYNDSTPAQPQPRDLELAQYWGNFPNWPNWGNWNKVWNNWGNWGGWLRRAPRQWRWPHR